MSEDEAVEEGSHQGSHQHDTKSHILERPRLHSHERYADREHAGAKRKTSSGLSLVAMQRVDHRRPHGEGRTGAGEHRGRRYPSLRSIHAAPLVRVHGYADDCQCRGESIREKRLVTVPSSFSA